jgi:hypothetical protein
MPLDSWNMVTDAYEKAQPGVPLTGKKKVRFSQHCEITLALEMLRRYVQRQLSRYESDRDWGFKSLLLLVYI